MGARKALGVALTVASLAVLAYIFYKGAVAGMIGCAKVIAMEPSGAKKVVGVACDSSTLSKLEEQAKASGASVRVVPVDTPEALAATLAWMGLIVGPWLAFGEKPVAVGGGRP